TDFETKIVVKINAPALLRRELSRRAPAGGPPLFFGVLDFSQPLEAVYAVTRRCLEVCRDLGQPVGIVTKGALVRRDIDLLSALVAGAGAGGILCVALVD